MDAVDYSTLFWVDFLNNRQHFWPIGDVPPAIFENEYYRQQQSQAKAE
jgi:hypothetical protein